MKASEYQADVNGGAARLGHRQLQAPPPSSRDFLLVAKLDALFQSPVWFGNLLTAFVVAERRLKI